MAGLRRRRSGLKRGTLLVCGVAVSNLGKAAVDVQPARVAHSNTVAMADDGRVGRARNQILGWEETRGLSGKQARQITSCKTRHDLDSPWMTSWLTSALKRDRPTCLANADA